MWSTCVTATARRDLLAGERDAMKNLVRLDCCSEYLRGDARGKLQEDRGRLQRAGYGNVKQSQSSFLFTIPAKPRPDIAHMTSWA